MQQAISLSNGPLDNTNPIFPRIFVLIVNITGLSHNLIYTDKQYLITNCSESAGRKM